MKTFGDYSYPYRLTRYRAGRAGVARGLPPLVVVHGYTAEIYGMHGLVHLLADQLSGRYAVYEFAFETNPHIRSNYLSLELAARELGHELARVISADGLSSTGVAFVGHSTGGVVARRAFVDRAATWTKAKFVFLGTPHQGAEIAELKAGLPLGDKQVRELNVASDFLWRLNRDWSELPDSAVEGVLSIIGTRSTRSLRLRIPKGQWVEADGVVSVSSAFLAMGPVSKCFAVFVPLDHSDLKEIPRRWRELQSLSRRWQREAPDPRTSLPAIATIQFLRHASDTIKTHSDLWEQLFEMFEALEKDRNDTMVYEMACWREAPNGQWRQAARTFQGKLVPPEHLESSDDDLELACQLGLDIGFWREAWVMPADYVRPEEPECLGQLRQLLKESASFTERATLGWAIVRLEPVLGDVPAHLQLTRLEGQSWVEVVLSRLAFRRQGARWSTWFLPGLLSGAYRVRVSHGARSYVAEFAVQAPLAVLVELDGDGRSLATDGAFNDFRVLGGDGARAVWADLASGTASALARLDSRRWDIAGRIHYGTITSAGED